jgi:hypothetical protein
MKELLWLFLAATVAIMIAKLAVYHLPEVAPDLF